MRAVRRVVELLILGALLVGLAACSSTDVGFCEGQSCQLAGTYTGDLQIDEGTTVVLNDLVYIGNGVDPSTLTIRPGSVISGSTLTERTGIVIRQGSRIVAEGTAEKPIVFTSLESVGQRSPGDWAGLVLNGRAPINCKDGKANCTAEGEGGTGTYGGTDPNDDSGVLRYVRIEFGGGRVSATEELNGLTLAGVGAKTVIDHVQVHRAVDDGVEMFGGTVNIKYLLVTGVEDDGFDWTGGWQGKAQHVIVMQHDEGDNGIEADNNADQPAAAPRSKPMLSNFTLVGGTRDSGIGVLLRAGTGAQISNAVVTGWKEGCVDIDDAETFKNAGVADKLSGELRLTNSVIMCDLNYVEESGDAFKVQDFVESLNGGNEVADPMLTDATNLAKPDFRPKAGSPALSGAQIPNDPFFDKVAYRGASDDKNDWTAGWTTSEWK